jgi:hypothetical protein
MVVREWSLPLFILAALKFAYDKYNGANNSSSNLNSSTVKETAADLRL